MAKEIPIPKAHIIDRLKANIEHFQATNNCRMVVMVAYPDTVMKEGKPHNQIEMRLLCDMPDELLPQFLGLFAGLVEERKKSLTKEDNNVPEHPATSAPDSIS